MAGASQRESLGEQRAIRAAAYEAKLARVLAAVRTCGRGDLRAVAEAARYSAHAGLVRVALEQLERLGKVRTVPVGEGRVKARYEATS
jgi:hypothetical protein